LLKLIKKKFKNASRDRLPILSVNLPRSLKEGNLLNNNESHLQLELEDLVQPPTIPKMSHKNHNRNLQLVMKKDNSPITKVDQDPVHTIQTHKYT
jgi:hypothetical protein